MCKEGCFLRNKIRVLGVTGGIASGKSTVAQILSELGASVVSADELAREVVAPGSPVLAEVVSVFGKGVLRSDGSLDREFLGRRVFADEAARRWLEGILHPAIRDLSVQRLAELRGADVPLVVYEAPLLFEAGAQERVDAVLAVIVDDDLQLRRVMQRDDISRNEARARVVAQMPQHEKAARADFVIENNESLESLRDSVARLYHRLVEGEPA